MEVLRREPGTCWEWFSCYAENQEVGGYEMKLDGQVGLVQSHAKDFVLYSKGSGRALIFLWRATERRW